MIALLDSASDFGLFMFPTTVACISSIKSCVFSGSSGNIIHPMITPINRGSVKVSPRLIHRRTRYFLEARRVEDLCSFADRPLDDMCRLQETFTDTLPYFRSNSCSDHMPVPLFSPLFNPGLDRPGVHSEFGSDNPEGVPPAVHLDKLGDQFLGDFGHRFYPHWLDCRLSVSL